MAKVRQNHIRQAAALRSRKAQEDIVGFDVLVHNRFEVQTGLFITASFFVNQPMVEKRQGFSDRDDHVEGEDGRCSTVLALLEKISAIAMLE